MTSIPSRDAFPRRAVPPSIDEHDSDPANTERQPPWYIRIFTGRREDPRWARPALWGLILISAFLYLYKLSISGYANEFYAASVKSATQSWRAWLWASLDSQLSITVDKPPAAIWVMGLSARIFGFSSFSMLLPNALMGVATVGLTYGAVRRLSGHAAGLIAGAVVVITPVAALMFRFNNPDAMLVLCVTAAIYMVVRALQTDRGRTAVWWMVGAGWLIGLGFLTKMLQGLLVLPALALVYLLCARTKWWTRIWHLLAAAASMIVSAGWLIALCAVWPASSRPYIGGSENNSLWELAIGYNGLGRVLGGSGNGGGGGGAGGAGGGNASFGGEAGLLRMVNSSFATEISWLIPAAVLLLVTGLVARGRRPLSDRKRAGIILWGGSMILTALVFSFMQGTIHPYYSVALAPLIGGTIGSAGAALWPGDANSRALAIFKRASLALAIALTGVWGFHLLDAYASGWQPWIRWTALIGSLAGAAVFLAVGLLRSPSAQMTLRKVAIGALLVGSLTAVTPTAAWTVATATTAHSGSIPTSGPSGVSGAGMGGLGGGTRGGMGGGMAADGTGGGAPGGMGGESAPTGMGRPGGSWPGATGQTPTGGTGQRAQAPGGQAGSSGSVAGARNAPQGGGGTTVNSALVKLLNSTTTKWSAAVVGDQSAAGYILATDTAVFSIGGWSGSDNNVTLAQFKQYVADGKIHYFISGGDMGDAGGGQQAEGSSGGTPAGTSTGSQPGTAPNGGTGGGTPGENSSNGVSGIAGGRGTGGQGGGMGGGPGSSSGSASAITSWVTSTFTSKTVGGVTVYDLTSSKS